MTRLIRKFVCSMTRILVLLAIFLFLIWWLVVRPVGPAADYTGQYQETKMVDPQTLKRHVETLSQAFAPRDFEHSGNLDRTAEYIRNHFQEAGARVYDQPYNVEGVEYKNVIAEFGRQSDAVIIVGAHYDAVFGTPGADDNASGIAGLLEIARLLSDSSLNSGVVLAAYSLEEPPFFKTEHMGSDVHAKSLKKRNVNVRLMICFEMIGYFTQKPASQKFPIPFLKLFYPTTGNFIAIVDQTFSANGGKLKRWLRKKIDLPVYSINAPKWVPGVDWSDQRSYWKYGFPAVMITDTAFYRNEAYHTMQDTADRLDYENMAQVVYGIYSYVKHMANNR